MGCASSKSEQPGGGGAAASSASAGRVSSSSSDPCAAPRPPGAWSAHNNSNNGKASSGADLLTPREVLELAVAVLDADERRCAASAARGVGRRDQQQHAEGAAVAAATTVAATTTTDTALPPLPPPPPPPLRSAGVTAPMLAALALTASAGRPRLRVFHEHLGGAALGLCQTLLPTARWLASERAYAAYGPRRPSAALLLNDPAAALYFGAAYLAVLAASAPGGGGLRDARGEEWAVRALHSGPKGVASAGAAYEKYVAAKRLLLRLDAALRAERGGGATTTATTATCADCGGGVGSATLMHVVQGGESADTIAAALGAPRQALLDANPDLCGCDDVRPGDCLALPVRAVLPRLYALQPGDTLAAVARAHGVPLGRLLALNPLLRAEPRRAAPGWLVAVPGLKGDSHAGGSADALLGAAAAAASVAAGCGGGGVLLSAPAPLPPSAGGGEPWAAMVAPLPPPQPLLPPLPPPSVCAAGGGAGSRAHVLLDAA